MAGIANWAFTSIPLRHPVGPGSFPLAIFLCLHLSFPPPFEFGQFVGEYLTSVPPRKLCSGMTARD